MKKLNIQQRKCSACHPLIGNGHKLINSFVDHTVFYVGADISQTPLQFADILYRNLVNAILNQPIFCSRLDSGLVHSSRWPKILKHFSKLLK